MQAMNFYVPTRTVVGAMLEFQGAWKAMEPAMLLPPHHRPPVHPVLYIKPANTWCRTGDTVWLPAIDGATTNATATATAAATATPTGGAAGEHAVAEIEVGATLGITFARTAARVSAQEALSFVSGYCVVNDVTVPHSALLRPPMRQKCRDGFCPIGPWVPAAQVADPGQLTIRAYVNGQLRQTSHTSQLRRSVAQLIADVSEFMSLAPGDLLLIGVAEGAPRAKAGDTIAVEIDSIGRLENPLRRETPYKPALGSGEPGEAGASQLTKQVSA
jgi:5-oxopent-3-ene-1,2,5-tricarboxylate decarboxylase / 2-hydroxyhepta-2,4-diene-1,7-dioate isomerase